MKKAIIIVGPTASGKSKLAINLAKEFNLEIINADAFQVYKEISIGVDKPSYQTLKEIKHYFISTKSINEPWNIKVFKDECYKLIIENEKPFIIVGGSNLYIDAIIKNYNLPNLSQNKDLNNLSNVELWNKLKKIDEKEATKIGLNNKKRLIQAIRIIESTNQKKSDLKNLDPFIDPFVIKINIKRDCLYEKINKRIDKMQLEGWIEEVKKLVDQKIDFTLPSLKAIGYNEIANGLINNEVINWDLIKKKTRNYAKRQETWCKNKFNINFFYNSNKDYKKLKEDMEKYLNEK